MKCEMHPVNSMCLQPFAAINVYISKSIDHVYHEVFSLLIRYRTFVMASIACFIAAKNMVILRKTMSRVEVKYYFFYGFITD